MSDADLIREARYVLVRLERLADRMDLRVSHGAAMDLGLALALAASCGAALREERHRRGMSLHDVERATGLKASVLGAWEREERWPSRPMMARLAEWLRKPEDMSP